MVGSEVRWFKIESTSATFDNGDTRWFGVTQDITDRKQAEAALQESEEKHRRLFETMAHGVVYHAADGSIISANPAAERILGLSLEQMQGKTCMDPRWKMIMEDGTAVPGEDHPAMITLRTGETVGPVVRGVFHPDKNSHIWLSITAIPLFQPGDSKPFQVYATFEDITDRKQAEDNLKRIEWMLSRKPPANIEVQAEALDQGYGDLTELNREGIILKSIGKERLKSFAGDYLELLETSSAIYEANGDYAFGIFASGWCRMMDRASRNLCDTPDNAEALKSGRWLCHESCWTDCSKEAIARRSAVDIECNGGIRLFAVPIFAGEEIIGAMNFGYGDPPKDAAKLKLLADAYRLDFDDLHREANAYDSRPPYIIEMAKNRLKGTAKLIGSMVEAKLAEKALMESEARFRTLFNESPVSIIIHDKVTGEILDGNEAAFRAYGLDSLEALQETEFWTDPPYSAHEALQWIHKSAAEGVQQFEWKNQTISGEVFWEHVTLRPVIIDGEERILSVAVDITKRKQTEEEVRNINQELQKSNADKDRLFSFVAHDLKSPIAGFLSLTEVLSADIKDFSLQELEQMTREMHKSSEGLYALLEDLLQWSRLQRGLLDYNPESACLNDIVTAGISIAKNVADQKNIDLRGNVPEGMNLFADQKMLYTVIRNLIFNALKFTHRGGNVSIHAHQDGSMVRVIVHDDGMGMDQETAAGVFAIDQKRSVKGTEGEKGTGLGLILCKEFVEKHGGRIWIESEPGQGTTVSFTVPSGAEDIG